MFPWILRCWVKNWGFPDSVLRFWSPSSKEKEIASKTDIKKTEQAAFVGKLVASKCKDKGIAQVVFDRGGYKYHGRVKSLADAAREGGLKF